MIDCKNILNLPFTKFPMRANLIRYESVILQLWYKKNIYKLIRIAKKGKEIFLLHDGPPYVNGNIHIGHAVNKILKDIIIKSKGLSGYDAPYVPGWDCHGLPIELKVKKLIDKSNKLLNMNIFRDMCRNYSTKQVINQKKDFIRLGILGDWDNSYLTMNFVTEANIIRTLGKVIANGYLYKGTKPVYWCIKCLSVLAEAEVEYYDCISQSVYVTFILSNIFDLYNKFGIKHYNIPIGLVIWNTTPWTLPGNKAVAVHPDYEYQLIEIDNKVLIIASILVEKVMHNINIVKWKVIGSIQGEKLEFIRLKHPFMDFEVPVVLSKHITLNMGTGIVHIAPAHGVEDYIIGKKYNLGILNLINEEGCYINDILYILNGVKLYDANNIIIDLLHKSGNLVYIQNIEHSYPHCYRHTFPVIFRSTSQWFISIDKDNLRQRILSAIQLVHWIPDREKSRIIEMVSIRPDWCISRQRAWGVPITLFVHKETNVLHPRTIELIEIIANKVEKNGIQIWWDLSAYELIGDDAYFYNKVSDILDIWFESGSTYMSVIINQLQFCNRTIDLYLEGSDQYRGWFMSSLILSMITTGHAPYKQVLSHGFVVDFQGCKMSKSIGNVLSPQKVVDILGADILRLWVSSTNYINDMPISFEILRRSVDIYRRIRNTIRFFLANLHDFDPDKHLINPNEMIVLDRWAVSRAYCVQESNIKDYNNYNFHNIIKRIMYFCSIYMGSFYLDIIKDRQYTFSPNSIARRSCQTALYHILEAIVRWISPIMSFTADEIWGYIPGCRTRSIFTEEWYNGLFEIESNNLMNHTYWMTLLKVRNAVNKVIEKARMNKLIKGSLEVNVILYADPHLAKQLRMLGDELIFVLLTSSVRIEDYSNYTQQYLEEQEYHKGLKILLNKAEGNKCIRCWHYETNVGSCIDYPDICLRCINNIFGDGEVRQFV